MKVNAWSAVVLIGLLAAFVLLTWLGKGVPAAVTAAIGLLLQSLLPAMLTPAPPAPPAPLPASPAPKDGAS